MTYNIRLNKNKSIGKVVYIVEGDRKEHSLLRHIFERILDYTVVDVKRKQSSYLKYMSKVNPDSCIFVVSSEKSNVKSAGEEGKAYLDSVFSELYKEYSLDISNSAVYYIFDRDNQSNSLAEIENLVKTLKNSRDNGIENNGLLLLSYPSIEAYVKMCIDDIQFQTIDTPKSLKVITSDAKYQYDRIDSDALLKACNNMLVGINRICDRYLIEADLDDFFEINYKILAEENRTYAEHREYILLSLLSISFLDLGILNIQFVEGL